MSRRFALISFLLLASCKQGAPVLDFGPGMSWQWQLSGEIDTSLEVAAYDVDLFDASDEVLGELRDQGRIILCYFSAGSFEDWREDAGDFDPADIGNPLDGWDGEWWLDIRSQRVRDLMEARLDRAKARGCDGVEPDNVDGYSNDAGFPLSEDDQLLFNRFLAAEAHARQLTVGLKNALELLPALVDEFDWALNEECVSFDECAALTPFLDAGKPVLHTEYVNNRAEGPARRASVCGENQRQGFSTLIKTWDLDAWRLSCD